MDPWLRKIAPAAGWKPDCFIFFARIMRQMSHKEHNKV